MDAPVSLLEAILIELLLQEAATGKEILKQADRPTKQRSEPLDSVLTGLNGNVLTFRTRSGTDPSKHWIQKVQVSKLAKALQPLWDGQDKKVLPAIRRAVQDAVKVSCNCPAFKWWGFAYISTKDGFKVGGAQNKFPNVRNPGLKGTVCKHLVNVLQTLPFQAAKMASMFKKQNGL